MGLLDKKNILLSGVRYFPLCLALFFPKALCSEEYLEMDLEELLQVSITGSTLRDESLKTVPSVVTVFTRERIHALGFDYLYELLNLVPGYQSNRNADSPSGYTFSARGRRNSAEAREVLLIVDGRVFADPRTGSADGSLPLFPLAQVERVEIISGPGSAIYGSGAFNGVINIISRRQQNAVSLAMGSDGMRNVDLLVSHNLGEWTLNAYSHLIQEDGQNYHLQTGQSTRDPRDALALNLDLDNGTTRLQGAYHHLDSDNFYSIETIDNGFNHYIQEFQQLGIDHNFMLMDSLKTRLSLSYVAIEQKFHGLILPEGYLSGFSDPSSEDAFLVKGLFAGTTWRMAIANDLDLDEGSSVQFGMEWRRNQETAAEVNNNYDLGQLARGDFPISYYGDFSHSTPIGHLSSQEASALYGQWLYDLNDSTRLTLGSRFDDYASVGHHISPRVGLVHQFLQYQTLKLLYGEAFRAPSLSELGLMNNPVLVGNPNLDYEIVKTWDVVWQGTWNDTSLVLDGFYNEYTQPIASGFIGSTRTYVNDRDESSRGASLEINQQLSPQWLVRMSATHFFDLPDSAFREATELGSVTINYSAEKWNWSMAAVYQGTRDYPMTSSQQSTLDAYWVLTSQLRYSINKNIHINAVVKNLSDEDYATPAQGAGIIGGVPNRGREWKLGVDWEY